MTGPKRSLTRIPPRGRRASVIRAATEDFVSMSRIVRQVRAVAAIAADRDPAIDRLKTTEAVRDLRRRGLIARTPWGYRATAAGVALLRASEGHHV